MPEVRTRDEALVAIDRGLAQWATTATGLLTQTVAAAGGAQASANAAERRCTTKVVALAQLLRSLRPEDDHATVERELSAAGASLRAAHQAAQQITSVVQGLIALQRKHMSRSVALVDAARGDLTKRTNELASYRGAAGGGGPSVPVSSGGGGGGGGGSAWLDGTGLAEIEVAAAEFGDNPIIGSFGRGETTRADYRWAVQTWDEVVRPGLARGMTRSDFEERDQQRGSPELRRTARVYDLFLGDSRLRVTRLPGGKFDVIGGRHRLQVARELGIRSLPAEVRVL